MSTPEQPTTDHGQSLPVKEKVPHMVDVAPLLRGDVKGIRIPVFKAKPGLNIEVYEAELRVVREVEAMCGDHGGIDGCSCSECSAPVMPEAWTYCPGCGNKVKWHR